MGLIHSAAAKSRDRAEAALMREQAALAQETRLANGGAERPWYLQPSIGAVLAARRHRKAAESRPPGC